MAGLRRALRALQVINHLQDCAEDYRELDRVYLPRTSSPRTAPRSRCSARAARVRRRCARRIAELGRAHDRTASSTARRSRRAIADFGLALEIAAIEASGAPPARAISESRDPLSERRASGQGRLRLRSAAVGVLRRLARGSSAAARAPCRPRRQSRRVTRRGRARSRQLVLLPRCASCRARSARRCSRSTPSAAPSTTSPTSAARRRRTQRIAELDRWRADIAALFAGGRRPPSPSLAEAVRALRLEARGFRRRDRRHGDGRRPTTSARPTGRRSTSIATASPARSGGCRCASSASRASRARRSPIISAARCSSPISCATSTRTPRSAASICRARRSHAAGVATDDPLAAAADPKLAAGLPSRSPTRARWHFDRRERS